MPSDMKYRPEIDGLRAIAVIPVVLFHAGLNSFSGGFVGVDIFFVISGYLIASIIISEVQEGSFSYLGFYKRRVRRILPALIVVILASLVASILFSLPEQVIQTSRASLFALAGLSNIYFWMDSGYFSPASEYSMLLHTWSLGVEEQFYIFLPAILIFVYRLKRESLLAVGVLLLFVFSLWLSFNKASAAFYLLPARAWELGLGVVLAAGLVPQTKNPKVQSFVAILGLSAILLAIFIIHKQMAYPGWAALIPCLGAAAVIHSATTQNLVGRALSLQPFRYIGLMSYSLYLWHWPVFVSLRLYTAEPHLPLGVSIFGIALSILFSAITLKFIEIPFRSRLLIPFRKAFIGIALMGGVSICVAVVFEINSGFPNRLSDQSKNLLSAAVDIDPLRQRCVGLHEISDPNCRFGAKGSPLDFVLIGDSHAGAIRPAIEEWAIASGRAGTILWRGACPLLFGATTVPDTDAEECAEFKSQVISRVGSMGGIKTVILAGRWAAAYSGVAPEIGGSYRTYLIDEKEFDQNEGATKRVFERALHNTAKQFEVMGKKVVFIGSVPELGFDVPRVLALASHNQQKGITSYTGTASSADIPRELDHIFERVAAVSPNRDYISLWQYFCTPECAVLLDGVPLYSDDDHLTYSASKLFVGKFVKRELTNIKL